MAHSSAQQDSSMRVDEDARIRDELTACLARDVAWKNELRSTRIEVQKYLNESTVQRRLSTEELCSMREAYRKTNAVKEIMSHALPLRSRLSTVEQQVTAWVEGRLQADC